MNQTVLDAFNEQINEELYSAYLYLAMSSYFHSFNLPGAAHWMFVQYKEELQHAEKFIHFILERGPAYKLKEIKEPTNHWPSPLDAFKAALTHEKHITQCINNLVELTLREKDFSSMQFLQWFVDEQVEEEANASKIIDDIERIGNDSKGLYFIDKELGNRPNMEPSSEAEAN